MNKTVTIIVIGTIVLVGLGGLIWLTLHRPEATASFTSTLILLLSTLVTAAGTIYGLGEVGKRVTAVERNTNGNLDKERNQRIVAERELAAAREQLAANTGAQPAPALATPATASTVAATTVPVVAQGGGAGAAAALDANPEVEPDLV